MRIKKTSTTTTLPAQVVNTYDTSEENTYSCDYVNDITKYSTTETIVGYNDDGKPVYRKCFNGNIADTTTLAQNVAEFYGTKGYTEVISGTGSAMPYYEYSTTGFYLATVQFIPASNYIRFRAFRNGQAITAKANFYVEYTKTTD